MRGRHLRACSYRLGVAAIAGAAIALQAWGQVAPLEIRGINPARNDLGCNFPFVEALVNVSTPTALTCTLSADNNPNPRDNFVLYENGVLQEIQVNCIIPIDKPIVCKSASQQKQVICNDPDTGQYCIGFDIVFVFDDTESMGDQIALFQSLVGDFVQSFVDAGVPARFGLVTFANSPFLLFDEVEVDLNLTANTTQFLNAVNALDASGGSDIPELTLDAWLAAINQPWGNCFGTQRLVIIITDAPVHHLYDGDNKGSYPNGDPIPVSSLTYKYVFDRGEDRNVNTYVVSKAFAPGAIGPYLNPDTLGEWLDIETNGLPDILDRFKPRPETSRTYLLRYRSTDESCCEPAPLRNVTIELWDPDFDANTTFVDTATYRCCNQPVPAPVETRWIGHRPLTEMPTISMGLYIDPSLAPPCSFDAEDFHIFEDDVEQTITHFECANNDAGRQLDLVFVLDNSGSMVNERDALIEEIGYLAVGLGESGFLPQYGLLSVVDNPAITVPLTADTAALEAGLAGLTLGGQHEYTLDAIMLGLSGMAWRNGSTKIFVVLTDEPATLKNYTMPAVADALNAANAHILIASPVNFSGTLPLQATDTNLRLLALATDGAWLNIDGIDLTTFKREIVDLLSAMYVIHYNTTNTDLDGQLRIVRINPPDGIGCFPPTNAAYRAPKGVYVNQASAAKAPDGFSWATAVTTIEAGIDLAADYPVAEVWVAQGRYDEQRRDSGALVLPPGLALRGGFVGTETLLGMAEPWKNKTIIDGSKARGGAPAYHVLVGAKEALVDGFEITGGNASGTGDDRLGGGLFARYATMEVRDSVFHGNTAQYGGAIQLAGGSSTIANSLFYGNTAYYGGAFHLSDTTPAIVHCTIVDNTATESNGSGGGIYASNSEPALRNTIVWHNASGDLAFAGDASGSQIAYSNLGTLYVGEGNLSADPLFVSRGNRWYWLNSNSPSLDTGDPSVAIPLDLRGRTRPQLGGPDMGAFEYLPILLDAPIITTDGGNGPGQDFETAGSVAILEGTTNAASHALLINGSTQNVAYTPGETLWAYSRSLAEGSNPFNVSAVTAKGEPSPAARIVITRYLIRSTSISLTAVEPLIELEGSQVAIEGHIDLTPAPLEGMIVNHPVRVRYFRDGEFVIEKAVLIDANYNFASALPPDAVGLWTVQAKYEGAVHINASEWSEPVAVEVVDEIGTGHPYDTNNDGIINALDIQLVINAALGIDVGAVDADVNNDGAVNALDIQIIINAALGIV